MSKKSKKASLNDNTLNRFGKELPETISEFYTLLNILKSFGITSAYEHLENPETLPKSCINKASRSLDVMAFHGDKWLFESWFETDLERLRLRQGKVRFLLSDTIDSKTVNRCKELIDKYPSVFSVRVFSETAVFRTVIIDDNFLLLGHYGYEVIENDGLNAKGWKSPQLYIEDNKHWSLLIPFKELFRTSWDKSNDVSLIDSNKSSNSVIKREFQPKSFK